MRETRVKVAAGLSLAVLVGIGSCRDQAAPDDPGNPVPPGIVSDPASPTTATASAGSMALLAPSVAYVSFRPGTFPGGVAATISNARTISALTLPLLDGGLDPVAIPAEAGDSLSFTVDVVGSPLIHFIKVVPPTVSATVVRTEPSGGKRDVPLNIRVRVVFSEPVDPTSVTSTTVRLLRNTAPVDGQLAVSPDGLDATFTPAANLLPGTDYTLAVGDGVRDGDGAPLDAPVTADFTTGTSSGDAVALSFDLQPVRTLAGLPIPPVVVTARDAAGNLATGFTGDITLALGVNPGGATLSGTATRAGAEVRFDDLRIDVAGAVYTLVATSPGLLAATSTAFDVAEPGGDLLAYSSYGEGIVVRQSDGATSALDPTQVEAFWPTWSPDGRWIAFNTLTPERVGDLDGAIYVMRSDGRQVTSLHQPGYDPAWSPGGPRIAFTRTEANGHAAIYVMSAQGTDVVKLTESTGSDYGASWSPDGRQLAFARSSSGPYGLHDTIYVMNADGSGLTSLGREGSFPAWSPDGASIAFSRLRTAPYLGDIYVMRADGSALTKLTSNQSSANSYAPAWSADGSRIAFSSSPDPDMEPYQIYVMNADGTGIVKVSQSRGDITRASLGPAWSP